MGRSRGGVTSKVHAVVDANGLPVRLDLTPGEAHDNRLYPMVEDGKHTGALPGRAALRNSHYHAPAAARA